MARGAAGATLGIVVIGEKPYAEFEGDRADLSLDKEDLDTFHAMKGAGIPTVAILLSGRPMIVNDVLDHADGFSPHGSRAPKAKASPTSCLAISSPPANCRSRGRSRWRSFRSTAQREIRSALSGRLRLKVLAGHMACDAIYAETLSNGPFFAFLTPLLQPFVLTSSHR